MATAAQLGISYAGKPLRSGQRVYWKTRVWDAAGLPSRYSDPASWEMALLSPADWKAQWISHPRPVSRMTVRKCPNVLRLTSAEGRFGE